MARQIGLEVPPAGQCQHGQTRRVPHAEACASHELIARDVHVNDGYVRLPFIEQRQRLTDVVRSTSSEEAVVERQIDHLGEHPVTIITKTRVGPCLLNALRFINPLR